MTQAAAMFAPRLAQRRRKGTIFAGICLAMTLVGVFVLSVLVFGILGVGGKWLSWNFLTSFPSQLDPESSGIRSAISGSLWLIFVTAAVAIPIGMAAAIYLHEFASRNRLTHLIEINISNLAGVPSIVYGILGLAIFVRDSLGIFHALGWLFGQDAFTLGRSVVAAGLTLALLVLPVIIIASREALSAVPDSFRQAALAVGATRWQTVRSHVLPVAMPGMMTGVILALSRAIGEAAPLIVVGAAVHIAFVPEGFLDSFTALPVQIFHWAEQPDAVYQELAAAAIIVLLGILLPMNAIAVAIRAWQQRKKAW